MVVKNNVHKIRCDLLGCGNLAEFIFKKDDKTYDSDGLKLCNTCVLNIVKNYKLHLKKFENKEKVNEKNDKAEN